MQRRFRVLAPTMLVAIAAALMGQAAAQNTLGEISTKSILYLNADRTAYMQIKNQAVYLQAVLSPDDDTDIDSGASAAVRACSDQVYRCVRMSNMVFAVPRNELPQSGTYVAAGARFTIQKCLQKSQNDCTIAMIKSDCEFVKEPGQCSTLPNGRQTSSHAGPVVYFVYSSKAGVTSLGFGSDAAPDQRTAENIAKMYRLAGQSGFLNQ